MPCKNSKVTKNTKSIAKPTPAEQGSFISTIINHVVGMAERWGAQEGIDDKVVAGFCDYIKKDGHGVTPASSAKPTEAVANTAIILLDAYAKEHGIFYPPLVKETVHDALADAGINTSAKKIKAKWDGLTFAKSKLDEVKETLSDFDLTEEPASEFQGAPWDLPVKTKKGPAKEEAKKVIKKEKSSEPEFETNKWGNTWDSETGLVVHALKAGKKTTHVAIGTQNTKAKVAQSKKDPWSSVLCLDEDSPTLEGVELLTKELSKKFPKKLREKLEELELIPGEEVEEEEEEEESEDSD